MSILPYVYKCTHKETGEFYIGFRSANKVKAEDDLGKYYFTSSKLVKPRFGEFNSVILAEAFDKKKAFNIEQEMIFNEKDNPLLLNKACYWTGHLALRNWEHTEETKRKIGDANKISLKGRKQTKEEIKNRSLANIGKHSMPRTGHWLEAARNARIGQFNPRCSCPICKRELSNNRITSHFDTHFK